MNIKPVPAGQGTGAPAGSQTQNTGAISPERIQRAKAIALGKSPPNTQVTTEDPQVQRAQDLRQKIKMKTQRSIYRDLPQEEQIEEEAAPVAAPESAPLEAAPQEEATTESNILYDNEETNQAEDLKPLSPQFAALAKQKRELQVKESQLLAREEALKKGPTANADQIDIARLKADPLAVLEEQGFTRDQIGEMLLSNPEEQSPVVTRLLSKVDELEKRLSKQDQNLSERDNSQRKQVLAQIGRDVDKIIASGDEYEMIRETGSKQDVLDKIEKHFDETGEVLDTIEAVEMIENELIMEAEKIARIKKVQGRLTPAQQAQAAPQNNQNNVRGMRTLTSRDGASVPLSARERAINAFHGRKT